MGKSLRTVVCSCVFGILALTSFHTSAAITISIFDGTTTRDASMATNGLYGLFRLSKPTLPGDETSFRLLACTTVGRCTVYFPSGKDSPDPNDTYMFRDRGYSPISNMQATVMKSEIGGVARLIIYNLEITARKTLAKPLTITFQTQLNDLKQVDGTMSSGTFPFMPQIDGRSNHGSSYTVSNACKAASYANPCVKLKADIAIYVMSTLQSTTSYAVSVPCSNSSAYPCGPGGSYYERTGYFSTLFPAGYPCTSKCDPVHTGMITGVLPEPFEILTIYDAATLLSPLTVENFGVEDVAYAAAASADGYFWVSFSSSNQPPSAYYKWVPAEKGVVLTAIADNSKPPKPNELLNDRSYASFIAKPLQLRWLDVSDLTLNYKFFIGTSQGIEFSDCENASFHVIVKLTDPPTGKDVGNLKIRLGNTANFTSGCAARSLDENLVTSPDERVDAIGLNYDKLLTVGDSMKKYGQFTVRSISVVVDRGSPMTDRNYRVDLFDATVNGVKATDSLFVVQSTGK